MNKFYDPLIVKTLKDLGFNSQDLFLSLDFCSVLSLKYGRNFSLPFHNIPASKYGLFDEIEIKPTTINIELLDNISIYKIYINYSTIHWDFSVVLDSSLNFVETLKNKKINNLHDKSRLLLKQFDHLQSNFIVDGDVIYEMYKSGFIHLNYDVNGCEVDFKVLPDKEFWYSSSFKKKLWIKPKFDFNLIINNPSAIHLIFDKNINFKTIYIENTYSGQNSKKNSIFFHEKLFFDISGNPVSYYCSIRNIKEISYYEYSIILKDMSIEDIVDIINIKKNPTNEFYEILPEFFFHGPYKPTSDINERIELVKILSF